MLRLLKTVIILFLFFVEKIKELQLENKVNNAESKRSQKCTSRDNNKRRKYNDIGHKKGGYQKKDKFHFNPDDFP